MNTYNWTILSMGIKETNGQQNVVYKVSWVCKGTNGAQGSFKKDITNIIFDSDSQFTPYENLTEQEVLTWVWNNGVNKTEVEAFIDTNIQNQIARIQSINSSGKLPPPWVT